MRLINVGTMRLEEYFGSQIPKYAILSHCWGTEEVTFQDIAGPDWRRMRGASKIERSSALCHEYDLKYIWIDTCCIDKSSSAELSEAINSMYNWYAKSDVCFAYLEDVEQSEGSEAMRKSRWFTRGWTLQELIAPKRIKFYDQRWMLIGKKRNLSALLSDITFVPADILKEPSELRSCSVARKMSWAAYRETTREEDIAYCLLGIFDVNMPLLYGEGKRAFTRLQEEILKETDDQSLFAWGMAPRSSPRVAMGLFFWERRSGVLASHPEAFAMSKDIIPFPSKAGRQPYSMSNKGLHIELPLAKFRKSIETARLALLDCHYEDDFSSVIGIPLRGTGNGSEFERSMGPYPGKCSIESLKETEVCTIFISKRPSEIWQRNTVRKCLVRVKCPDSNIYTVDQVDGYNTKWSPEAMVLTTTLLPKVGCRAISSTLMFTDEEHRNSSFAIIIATQPSSSSQKRFFNVLLKPREVNLDEWSKELKAGVLDWGGMQEKMVQLNVLPDDQGADRPLTIKASLKEQEILNQWIDVLIVEISRERPRVEGMSIKGGKSN